MEFLQNYSVGCSIILCHVKDNNLKNCTMFNIYKKDDFSLYKTGAVQRIQIEGII